MKNTKGNLAPIAGFDDLEHDISMDALLSLVGSIQKSVDGISESPKSLCDIPEDDDEAFFDEALKTCNSLLQAAQRDEDVPIAPYQNKEEFVSTWIAKNEKRLRRIVERFSGAIADSMWTEEDLMQEAYFAVYKAAKLYNPSKTVCLGPDAYFDRAVFNKMLEICRTANAKRRSVYSQCIPIETFDFEGMDDEEQDVATGRHAANIPVVANDNVEQVVADRDLVIRLLNMVKNRKKSIVELTAVGYTQTEIGKYLGIQQSLVSYNLKEARKELMG